jgi:hypothetical protein
VLALGTTHIHRILTKLLKKTLKIVSKLEMVYIFWFSIEDWCLRDRRELENDLVVTTFLSKASRFNLMK